jgi:hypothetical protein
VILKADFASPTRLSSSRRANWSQRLHRTILAEEVDPIVAAETAEIVIAVAAVEATAEVVADQPTAGGAIQDGAPPLFTCTLEV